MKKISQPVKNVVLAIAVLLCAHALVAQEKKEKPSQDEKAPNVLIADSYDAETYWSYNKQSGKGRVGGLTANYDGPSLFSNGGYPIFFTPNDGDSHNYSFIMKVGKNGDPTFYSAKNAWFRIGASDQQNSGLAFWGNGKQENDDSPNLLINRAGKVGIGNTLNGISTANQNAYNLFVTNGVLSEKYGLGAQSSWADHVFGKDFILKPLSEVEAFISTYGHLPNIPAAAEIAENGYSLHEMNVNFLEKIEELTLHAIAQEKKIQLLEQQLNAYKTLADRMKVVENELSSSQAN